MRLLAILFAAATLQAQTAPTPCAGLPPGKHSLLERFTEQFGLTCEQQLKIEPLLHAEESVSKPLLAFAAFSPEEQRAVMTKIKLAARRQIKAMLTADQQKEMDKEIESVTASATKGGKKGPPKKAPPKVDGFENEETLSGAIQGYAALMPEEKTALIAQVKRAALNLELTAEQRKKIEGDLKK
jgi:hypothetical protein